MDKIKIDDSAAFPYPMPDNNYRAIGEKLGKAWNAGTLDRVIRYGYQRTYRHWTSAGPSVSVPLQWQASRNHRKAHHGQCL